MCYKTKNSEEGRRGSEEEADPQNSDE